jgi:hypothetical protein
MSKVTAKAPKLTAPSKIKAGDNSKVVNKTGYSPAMVSRVRHGSRYNVEIVNAFNSLTARRK